jgi:two-component system response regulator YesN
MKEQNPAGKTRRLLYVDDDAPIRQLVKRFFEMRFPAYEVILAASAEEALQELRQRLGGAEFPNAVVTDFGLGPFSDDGPALVETIRTQFPKLRTVVVSAVTVDEQVQRAAKAGANAFLQKEAMQTFVAQLFDLIQCPTNLLPPLAAHA